MSAREDLGAFVQEYVSDEHRSALSKLIAAFVAQAVREDRVKVATRLREREAQLRRVREAMDRVSALSGQRPALAIDDLMRGIL